MKIAPLFHALKKEPWADPVIVHTGQHYDLSMSDVFFQDLNLPEPHIHLGVGSGSHAEQAGRVMMAYEKTMLERKPNMVVVVGDVNSTMACTIAAVKISFQRPLVAHLEAGLRSFDRTMPEEINRIVTDRLADLLWTPSPDGDENLIREGIDSSKIVRVGNIMIDSLEMLRPSIQKQKALSQFRVTSGKFGLVTLHRPANVDQQETLAPIVDALLSISRKLPLIFPIHPRTRKSLEAFGMLQKLENAQGLILSEPLGYMTFMSLVFECCLAVTDSGGIQEETTYLGIPCLTLRPNTERPVTITQGTNRLCTAKSILKDAEAVLSEKRIQGSVPDLWDGKTAERVVQSIEKIINLDSNAG
jgi:UDP-N-acetylglucosamine 2-epimerase (non-hydrolysing)